MLHDGENEFEVGNGKEIPTQEQEIDDPPFHDVSMDGKQDELAPWRILSSLLSHKLLELIACTAEVSFDHLPARDCEGSALALPFELRVITRNQNYYKYKTVEHGS